MSSPLQKSARTRGCLVTPGVAAGKVPPQHPDEQRSGSSSWPGAQKPAHFSGAAADFIATIWCSSVAMRWRSSRFVVAMSPRNSASEFSITAVLCQTSLLIV